MVERQQNEYSERLDNLINQLEIQGQKKYINASKKLPSWHQKLIP